MEATFEKLLVDREKKESKKRKTLLGSFILNRFVLRYKRTVKKRQIKKRIKTLKFSFKKNEEAFLESLTDPTIDSVALKMKSKCIERELGMTKDIYRQLFYNRILLFFIKLFTKKSKK